MPVISVIVCTRNRATSLVRLLKSLRRLQIPADLGWDLVIVDNGSTDRTEKVVRRFDKHLPIRYVQEPRPGLSRARNKALDIVGNNHTVWTDDDATADPEWLSVYERAFRYWPQYDFFGGPVSVRFEGKSPVWIEAASDVMPEAFARLEPTGEFIELGPASDFFPFGANMAFRAGVFASRRFDPLLGRQPGAILRGGEEIQLIKDLVRQDRTGLWLPPARIDHWIDSNRQTVRSLYDHAFGDGFVGELPHGVGSEVAAVDPEAIDSSFRRFQDTTAQTNSDSHDWLARLKATAEQDGRDLACSLIKRHHRYGRRRKNRPLLAISLDGFDGALADRWIAEGKLPNLAALQNRSARYALDHSDALFTGLAGEHFSIGRSPSAYGRYSAVDFDVARYEARQRGTVSPTFLDGLDAHCVVFDVPYFDLSRTPAASGMTNWGAHDPGTIREARPDSLAGEIHRQFGGYPAADWIYGFVWPDPAAAAAMAERLEQSTQIRGRIARWLLTERFPEWDLALVGAGDPHSAIEGLWHGIDPAHPLHGVASSEAAARGIRGVYDAIDQMIGDLRAARPDADLLVFSMHGMGPNLSDVASMLLLPELMFRNAFHTSAFTPDPRWMAEAVGTGVPGLSAGENWSAAVNACIQLPTALTGSGNVDEVEGNLHWMPAERYHPAWPDMDAFALPSLYDGRIRINLAGRESSGRVSTEDYESTCKKIIDLLLECRDLQTGEPIVDHIKTCERSNPLDVDPSDCDLKVRWSRAALGITHPTLGTIGPAPYRRPGGHGGYGVAWLDAEGVAPGNRGVASSFDITPTILAMLGEPPSDAVSGRALSPGTVEPD